MKLLFAIASLFIFPAVLSASVISGGTITVSGGLPTGTFEFNSDDFYVNGSYAQGYWGPASCFYCSGQQYIPVNASLCCSDFMSGDAIVNGVTYSNLWWGDIGTYPSFSDFEITGPTIPFNYLPGTYSGPFSFTGKLCGSYMVGSTPRPCAVEFTGITGSGTVYVNMILVGGYQLQWSSATYVFTPEPASMVMMGCGLVAIGLWRRRRLA